MIQDEFNHLEGFEDAKDKALNKLYGFFQSQQTQGFLTFFFFEEERGMAMEVIGCGPIFVNEIVHFLVENDPKGFEQVAEKTLEDLKFKRHRDSFQN